MRELYLCRFLVSRPLQDPAEAGHRLRRVWGGAREGSRARPTHRALESVLEEVLTTPGLFPAGVGQDRVDLDRRYGGGLTCAS